jgi:hypothetical protein
MITHHSTMAAGGGPAGSSIEALFRPSTRLQDLYAYRRARTKVELLTGLTVENIMAAGIKWDDLCRFLPDKIAWMAPDVYVCMYGYNLVDTPRVLTLGGDPYTSVCVFVMPNTDAAATTATCDFLLRFLTTSEHVDVCFEGSHPSLTSPISGAALSLFFQESRSYLRTISVVHSQPCHEFT